jgi:hypothetical protein
MLKATVRFNQIVERIRFAEKQITGTHYPHNHILPDLEG